MAAAARGFGSSWPQHQQPVASTAWPRLGHLPTGRGRGLRGSGRSGSDARISGSHGLCRLALGSASSGMGGGRGRGRGRGSPAEEERREAVGAAGCAPEVPECRCGPSSRRRDAPGLAQVPAAAPTVRAPGVHGAEGGELRWRDALPAPAPSSARPGAHAALVCCGGDRGTQRSALAVRAAAAASWLPGATSEPQAGSPVVAPAPNPGPSGSAPESCARGLRRPRPFVTLPQATVRLSVNRERSAYLAPNLILSSWLLAGS